MSDQAKVLTRDEVLALFQDKGAWKPFTPSRPWHGHTLRDASFEAGDATKYLRGLWEFYVKELPPELQIQTKAGPLPRYLQGKADCENHAAWFLAFLQQVSAASAVKNGTESEAGLGAFLIDFTSQLHGNHQLLVFLDKTHGLVCFETLTGQIVELSKEEWASLWHISGG